MMLKIGHRGAKGHEPENTFRSFFKALELGCDMIETDIRVCKSGEPVLIHDETIDRTSDGKGEVAQLSLGQLETFDFGKKEAVPTLSGLLTTLSGRCQMNLELKCDFSSEASCRVIQDLLPTGLIRPEDILFSSFEHERLRECKKILPWVRIGLLFEKTLSDALELCLDYRAFSVHPQASLVEEQWVAEAKKMDLKIYPWTVNDAEEIQKLKRMGVDGIITDDPKLFSKI